MESWVVGVMTLALVNMTAIAFSYGSLTARVSALEKSIESLSIKMDTMNGAVANLDAMEKSVSWVSDTVRKCPTCNQWAKTDT